MGAGRGEQPQSVAGSPEGHVPARPPSAVIDPESREPLRAAMGLSPQEFRIVLCIADGMTQEMIAEEVGCSPHTVDSHVRRIFRKLRARNRANVVARLLVAHAETLRG